MVHGKVLLDPEVGGIMLHRNADKYFGIDDTKYRKSKIFTFRFPMVSLEFLIDIILPTALLP